MESSNDNPQDDLWEVFSGGVIIPDTINGDQSRETQTSLSQEESTPKRRGPSAPRCQSDTNMHAFEMEVSPVNTNRLSELSGLDNLWSSTSGSSPAETDVVPFTPQDYRPHVLSSSQEISDKERPRATTQSVLQPSTKSTSFISVNHVSPRRRSQSGNMVPVYAGSPQGLALSGPGMCFPSNADQNASPTVTTAFDHAIREQRQSMLTHPNFDLPPPGARAGFIGNQANPSVPLQVNSASMALNPVHHFQTPARRSTNQKSCPSTPGLTPYPMFSPSSVQPPSTSYLSTPASSLSILQTPNAPTSNHGSLCHRRVFSSGGPHRSPNPAVRNRYAPYRSNYPPPLRRLSGSTMNSRSYENPEMVDTWSGFAGPQLPYSNLSPSSMMITDNENTHPNLNVKSTPAFNEDLSLQQSPFLVFANTRAEPNETSQVLAAGLWPPFEPHPGPWPSPQPDNFSRQTFDSSPFQWPGGFTSPDSGPNVSGSGRRSIPATPTSVRWPSQVVESMSISTPAQQFTPNLRSSLISHITSPFISPTSSPESVVCPSSPPPEDLTPEDKFFTPQCEDPKWPGDIYTPKYKRRARKPPEKGGKPPFEGWCGLCRRWLSLKTSRFWEDKVKNHGINSRTRRRFERPLEIRMFPRQAGASRGVDSVSVVDVQPRPDDDRTSMIQDRSGLMVPSEDDGDIEMAMYAQQQTHEGESGGPDIAMAVPSGSTKKDSASDTRWVRRGHCRVCHQWVKMDTPARKDRAWWDHARACHKTSDEEMLEKERGERLKMQVLAMSGRGNEYHRTESGDGEVEGDESVYGDENIFQYEEEEEEEEEEEREENWDF